MAPEVYLELVRAKVAPADRPYEKGLEVADGRARPFVVERSWLGPMGHYWEQWSIRREGGEVVLEGPRKEIFVKGFQSIRTFTDTVEAPLSLEPGKYELVFHVEGVLMASVDIEARAPSSEAA